MSLEVAINFNDNDASAPADFSANGNGATSTTNLSVVSNGGTRVGYEANFSGDSKVDLPDIDALDGTDKLSFFCLLVFNDLTSGNDLYVFEDDGYELFYDDSESKLKFKLIANSTVSVTTSISSGTKYQITCVYDGSKIEMFKDGTSQGTASVSGSVTSGSQILHLGYQEAPTDQHFFLGKIEDFRAYSHAFTSDEVNAINSVDAGIKMTYDHGHDFDTGDILRHDKSSADRKGVVTWKISSTQFHYLPLSGGYEPGMKLFRVGNVFNSDRQHFINLRDDGVNADIRIFDGVKTTADIDSSSKETVKIDKSGEVDNSGSQRGELTIGDDSVKSVTPTRDTGKIIVWVDGADRYGEVMFDLSSPTGVLLVEMVNDTYSATTGNLSGTTSTDGHVNVSADDTNGEIDIENRTGSQRTLKFQIIS